MNIDVNNVFSWEPGFNVLLKTEVPAQLHETEELVRHVIVLPKRAWVSDFARTVTAMHVLRTYPALRGLDVPTILPYVQKITERNKMPRKEIVRDFWQAEKKRLCLPQAMHLPPISDDDCDPLFFARCFVQEMADSPRAEKNGQGFFSSVVTNLQKSHHDFLYAREPANHRISEALKEHAYR